MVETGRPGGTLDEEEDSMVTACGWAYTLLHRPYGTRVSRRGGSPGHGQVLLGDTRMVGPVPLACDSLVCLSLAPKQAAGPALGLVRAVAQHRVIC